MSAVGCEPFVWGFWLLLHSTLSNSHLFHVILLDLKNLKDWSPFQFRWIFSFIISSVKTGWNTVVNLNFLESERALFPQFPASIFIVRKGSPQKPTFPITASPSLSALNPSYFFLIMSVTSGAPKVQITPFYHTLIPTNSPMSHILPANSWHSSNVILI